MRRLIAFPCAGETLAATLDEGAGATGLLIVTGGNEVRAGAHRGMAMLAARLAADGVAVFRFDRRGVGDSTGENAGFAGSRDDLIAAAAAFRREAPHVRRIVGFGNCDAATALAMFGREAGIDALVLANPWTIADAADPLPPAAAIRARYQSRLVSPAAWWRVVTGRVDWRRAMQGVHKLGRATDRTLAVEVTRAIAGWGPKARVVLAREDATAIAYGAAARVASLAVLTTVIPTASHSFARAEDAAALEAAIRAGL